MATDEKAVMKYSNYTNYLRSYIKTEDHRYLTSENTKQKIVELNYRSINPVLAERKFYEKKDIALQQNKGDASNILYGDYLKDIDDEVLLALKQREALNVKRILSTIIYLRHRSKAGFEISGFIDYENSLSNAKIQAKGCVDWQAVFEGRKLLKPDRTQLSFRDAHKRIISYNENSNFKIIHDVKYGVLFLHRGDRKIVPLGPNPPKMYKDNVQRFVVRSKSYGLVILYDHVLRKQN